MKIKITINCGKCLCICEHVPMHCIYAGVAMVLIAVWLMECTYFGVSIGRNLLLQLSTSLFPLFSL